MTLNADIARPTAPGHPPTGAATLAKQSGSKRTSRWGTQYVRMPILHPHNNETMNFTITNFGRFARRGMLPLASTQTPATPEAQRVLQELRQYLRGTSSALDAIEGDKSWVNADAKTQRARTMLDAGRRQVAQLRTDGLQRFETEALRLESDLQHRLQGFEQSWGALAAQRIYRRAEQLAKQAPTATEAAALLDGFVLRRDAEGLATAYAAGLEGASQSLSRFLLGDATAEKTQAMKRDRLVLDLAFRVGELGLDELAANPAVATALTTRPAPDLVLAVAAGGPDALLQPSARVPEPQAGLARQNNSDHDSPSPEGASC